MTLSPVFRSAEAVETLRAAGVWDRLRPAALGQATAIATVKRDLPQVLDKRFIDPSGLGEERVDERHAFLPGILLPDPVPLDPPDDPVL